MFFVGAKHSKEVKIFVNEDFLQGTLRCLPKMGSIATTQGFERRPQHNKTFDAVGIVSKNPSGVICL